MGALRFIKTVMEGAIVASLSLTAHAAIIPATPSTFATVFAKLNPAGGDTVALAPGAYGGLDLSRKFVQPVLVTSADPTSRATVGSLYFNTADNVTVDGLVVDFVPDAKTLAWTNFVVIESSTNITIQTSKVSGRMAVAGSPETAGIEADEQIIGRPTGRCIAVQNSSRITIKGNEVSSCLRGIYVLRSSSVVIDRNRVHDTRKTQIFGSPGNDVTVSNNDLSTIAPWKWGQTPFGDHADFIAFWSEAGRPVYRTRITGNTMLQADGLDVLGSWLQGAAGMEFIDFTYEANVFNTSSGPQGIAIFGGKGGVIRGNIMHRINALDEKKSPSMIISSDTRGVTVEGNTVGMPIRVDAPAGTNTIGVNRVLTGVANLYGVVSLPAAVVPPVVAPVVPDPRDAQIAALAAQLASVKAQAATDLSAAQGRVSGLDQSLAAVKMANDNARAALAAIRDQAVAALAR